MQNIKDLICSFEKDDFFSKVNLHIHTNCSDGKATPQEVLEASKKLGLKFISITDHNTLNAYKEIDLAQEPMLISGIEFDCWHKGVLIHILGYGIDIDNSDLNALCAKTKKETEADIVRFFSLRNPQKVVKAIKDAGGLAVLAHPACCWTPCIESFVKSLKKMGLDGLEVYYPYKRHRGIIKFYSRKKILSLAEKYNFIKTGGTDEHGFFQ